MHYQSAAVKQHPGADMISGCSVFGSECDPLWVLTGCNGYSCRAVEARGEHWSLGLTHAAVLGGQLVCVVSPGANLLDGNCWCPGWYLKFRGQKVTGEN